MESPYSHDRLNRRATRNSTTYRGWFVSLGGESLSVGLVASLQDSLLNGQDGFTFTAENTLQATRAAQHHCPDYDVMPGFFLLRDEVEEGQKSENLKEDGSDQSPHSDVLRGCKDWRRCEPNSAIYFAVDSDVTRAIGNLMFAVEVFGDDIDEPTRAALELYLQSRVAVVARLVNEGQNVSATTWDRIMPTMYYKRPGQAQSIGSVYTIGPNPQSGDAGDRLYVVRTAGGNITCTGNALTQSAEDMPYSFYHNCIRCHEDVPQCMVYAVPSSQVTPPPPLDGVRAEQPSIYPESTPDLEPGRTSPSNFDAVSSEGGHSTISRPASPHQHDTRPNAASAARSTVLGVDAGRAGHRAAPVTTTGGQQRDTTAPVFQFAGATDHRHQATGTTHAASNPWSRAMGATHTASNPWSQGGHADGAAGSRSSAPHPGNRTAQTMANMGLDHDMTRVMSHLLRGNGQMTYPDGSDAAISAKALKYYGDAVLPWLQYQYNIVVDVDIVTMSIAQFRARHFHPVNYDFDSPDSLVSNTIEGYWGISKKKTDLSCFRRRKNAASLDRVTGDVTAAVRTRLTSPHAVASTLSLFFRIINNVFGGLLRQLEVDDAFITRLREWTDMILSDAFVDRDWSETDVNELVWAVNSVLYNSGMELRRAIELGTAIDTTRFIHWDEGLAGDFTKLTHRWALASNADHAVQSTTAALSARVLALEQAANSAPPATTPAAPPAASDGTSGSQWQPREHTNQVHKCLNKDTVKSFMILSPTLKLCPVQALGHVCTHNGQRHLQDFSHDPTLSLTQAQKAKLTEAMGYNLSAMCVKAWTG